jgi:hypothetical protein
MAWYIKGQAGKAMNATSRSFDTLVVSSAVLTFQSLGEDTFVYTASTTNAAGAGTVVPEEGQIIELLDDTARKFRGHVTRVEVLLEGIRVTVSGPWWWMMKIPLTGIQTDGMGDTADRASFVMGAGDLDLRFRNYLDRCIVLGVPMIRGTVADMFPTTKITLSNMKLADGLANLVRRCADAVVWFDYSGASGTDPTIRVSRRNGSAPMAAVTYTVGTGVEAASIRPREDLEVKRVEAHWMDRNLSSGRTRFQTQAAGTLEVGKLQIVNVSGPELVPFLPADEFETVNVQTVVWDAVTDTFVRTRDSGLASIAATVGTPFGTVASSFTRWTGFSDNKTALTTQVPGLRRISTTGAAFPPGTVHLVVSPMPLPEWAQKLLGAVAVSITGSWVASWKDSVRGVGTPWNAVFMAMQAGALTVNNGFENSATTGSAATYIVDWLSRPFQVSGYLIDTAFASLTTVHKPPTYTFQAPPAGMAAGMLAAQNWVPWEGPITVVADEVTGNNGLQNVYNLANARTVCATMRAPAKSVQHNILSGRTIVTLGAPARVDFATAVGRIPTSPQDLIIPI